MNNKYNDEKFTTSDYIKFGIQLSYLLRHNKDYNDITSEDRYIPVSTILKDMRLSFNELKKVVDLNDKKRFEFNSNYSLIRAKYGHSTKQSNSTIGELVNIPEEGLILYHGTTKDAFVDHILTEGLRPMRREYVHLTSDKKEAYKNAARFKNKKPVILEVKLSKGDVVYYSSPVYLIKHVSSDKLILINYIDNI